VGTADRAGDPDHAHQSGDLIPADAQASAAGGVPELASSVDAAIRAVQVEQLVRPVRVVEIRDGNTLTDAA
jgi:hypothetical protein